MIPQTRLVPGPVPDAFEGLAFEGLVEKTNTLGLLC